MVLSVAAALLSLDPKKRRETVWRSDQLESSPGYALSAWDHSGNADHARRPRP